MEDGEQVHPDSPVSVKDKDKRGPQKMGGHKLRFRLRASGDAKGCWRKTKREASWISY